MYREIQGWYKNFTCSSSHVIKRFLIQHVNKNPAWIIKLQMLKGIRLRTRLELRKMYYSFVSQKLQISRGNRDNSETFFVYLAINVVIPY